MGEYAFWGCTGLIDVIISDGVSYIGKSAFSICKNLKSIVIPSSVNIIGDYAFNQCENLTSATIREGVDSIGRGTFNQCYSLSSVFIPSSVTSIGYGAFHYCTGLTRIDVAKGNGVYDSRNNCNAIIETATGTLIQGCNNSFIPEGVTSIGEFAFWVCDSLTSVIIPSGVKNISSRAFCSCTNLSSITIPSSVTSIGAGAFYGCSSLLSVTIPEGVTNIENGTFSRCTNLTSVTIPEGVTTIGKYAFDYCTDLTSIVIPSTVTSIGEEAFYYCNSLANVTSLIVEPFTINHSVFYQIDEYATLYVPAGTIDAYKATDGWKNFKNIEEINVVGSSITITVINENSEDLTGNVSINWYDATGKLIGTGKSLNGIEDGTELYYSITLDEELGCVYREVKMRKVVVNGESLTCQLEKIGELTLHGNVTSEGTAIAGADVSLTQWLNGKYEYTTSTKTDENGEFTLKAYNDSTLLLISAKGYVDRKIERSRLYSADLGTIELEQAQGMVVSLQLSYQEAVREGEEPTVQSWYSDTRNIAYTVRNMTKDIDISDFAMQMGNIVLPFGSEPGDRILVTLRSLNDKFAEVSGEGVISSEGIAEIALRLVAYGGFEVVFSNRADDQLLVMLYGSDSKLVSNSIISSSRVSFTGLKAGSYTLVTLGYNCAIGSIGALTDLGTFGLVEGSDYVMTTVTVQDGIIGKVNIDDVPEIDASKFEYTSLNTSYLTNKSQMALAGPLSYITLTARVDFKTQYANEVNNVKLVVDIPEGCEFIANSVVVGTKALPHTLNGSQLIITLDRKDIDSRIRFCMMPKQTGTFTSTAYAEFNCRGEKRQSIGSAVFEATAGSISVPSITASKTIAVNGIAAPHATVDVYDGDQLIETTTALGDGKWRTEAELYKPYNLSTHEIYAKYQTADGIKATTESQECYYDINQVKVKSVTMSFYNGWMKKNIDVVFDFETGKTSSTNYSFYTATDFTFVADLTANDTTTVRGVTFYVHTSTKDVRKLKGFFDETLGRWVAVSKFESNSLPVNISVEVDALNNPMVDSEQIEESMAYKDIYNEEFQAVENQIENRTSILDSILSEDIFDIDAVNNLLLADSLLQRISLSEVEKQKVLSMTDDEWAQYVVDIENDIASQSGSYDDYYDTWGIEFQKSAYAFSEDGINGTIEVSSCEGYEESQLEADGYLRIPTTSGTYVYILSADRYSHVVDFNSNKSIMIQYTEDMVFARRANGMSDYMSTVQTIFSWISRIKNVLDAAYTFFDSNMLRQERLLEEHMELMWKADARIRNTPWWGAENLERDLNEYRRYRDISRSQKRYLDRWERARFIRGLAGKALSAFSVLSGAFDGYKMVKDRQDWDNLIASIDKIEANCDKENKKGELIEKARDYERQVTTGYGISLTCDLVGFVTLFPCVSTAILTFGAGLPAFLINVGTLTFSIAADHYYINRSDTWKAEIRGGIATLPKCNEEKEDEKKDDDFSGGTPTGGAAPITPPSPFNPITPVHDPSGYVYEAVPTNRVEGVTATIYFDQEKPTQWDVPQGMWQVRFEKSGYETTQTDWLPVPPPQLEINIPMSEAVAPTVVKALGMESGITLDFSKYMKPATLEKSGRVSATVNGKNASGDVEMLNLEEDPYNQKEYASKVKFVPSTAFKSTDEVVITVEKEVESYADKQMEADFVAKVKIEPEIKGFACDSIIAVDYQGSGVLEIAVLPATAAKGRSVTIASTSSMIATANGQVTLDNEGKAQINVNGNLPGSASLHLMLDGTDIEKYVEVNVVMNEAVVKMPKASKRSGSTIEAGYLLWLTCNTAGATIYYTLDGSCPCDEATRIKYTGPFALPAGQVTLKAVAVRQGMEDSDIVTYIYTVETSQGIAATKANHNFDATYSDGHIIITDALGCTVRVFDLAGRELAKRQATGKSIRMRVPQAESYIVSVLGKNGQTVVRKVTRR